MLKLYIARTRTDKGLYPARNNGEELPLIPWGKKIILAEALEEAKEILKEWTERYIHDHRVSMDYPDMVIHWQIKEKQLEKGIIWEDFMEWKNKWRSASS